jgi:hypothetical protein
MSENLEAGAVPADVAVLDVGEHDIVVIRSPEDISPDNAKEMHAAISRANPRWSGVLLCLPPDQSLEKIDGKTARELYAALSRVFGAPLDRQTSPRQVKKLKKLTKLAERNSIAAEDFLGQAMARYDEAAAVCRTVLAGEIPLSEAHRQTLERVLAQSTPATPDRG